MNNHAKKITLTAVTSACALIAFLIENLFPPLFVPGAKIGVSNVFILFTLIVAGYGEALSATLVKSVLGGLFSGNPSQIIYSLPSGILAVSAEFLLFRCGKNAFSVTAVSVVGAVLGNACQNAVYCLVTGTPQMFVYMPYLVLVGAVSGFTVGAAVYFIHRSMPVKFVSLH